MLQLSLFLLFLFRTLLIATGMAKPNIPDHEGMDMAIGYEDVPTDPTYFDGKSVLIFGKRLFRKVSNLAFPHN